MARIKTYEEVINETDPLKDYKGRWTIMILLKGKKTGDWQASFPTKDAAQLHVDLIWAAVKQRLPDGFLRFLNDRVPASDVIDIFPIPEVKP